MDIDLEDAPIAGSSTAEIKAPAAVRVDDEHPFDLDAYAANYSGKTLVDRMVHIMNVSPQIAAHAATLAAREIPRTRNPALYGMVQQAYDVSRAMAASLGTEHPPTPEVVVVDSAWVDSVTARNNAERQKLEVELKGYTTNMIKESIRMAHRDLGDFYRAVGDYTTSMRHHTKSREFCTTGQQVLQMNFACLELLIEQGHYAHISTYVFKADSALDALSTAVANQAAQAQTQPSAPAGAAQTAKKQAAAEREKVQSKLDYAAALSRLGQGQYDRAATAFLKIGEIDGLADWAGTLLSPGDIAIYGTLCALASFTRPAVKARVLDNNDFGVYIEQEPYVRELIDAYMTSKFKVVLELLEKFSTRHYMDIHLSSHVHELTRLIRDKCLVLYLQPFASIKLERMSVAFGWSIDDIEKAVVGLIQSGDIKARVDSLNKVLKARQVDTRAELFARATAAGADMQSATRKMLLRLRLQQADLVVKPPKGQQQMAGGASMDYSYAE